MYVLLEPLNSDDRQKSVSSVMTLLGEDSKPGYKTKDTTDEPFSGDGSFGNKANRWITQNGISIAMIEEIFHSEENEVEIIASGVPGNGKKGKTHNCYLLTGVQALLANDDARFTDSAAVGLCKHMGCHDAKNHAKNRNDLGNAVAGTANSGFTLPAPGLRAAAELIKEMSNSAK